MQQNRTPRKSGIRPQPSALNGFIGLTMIVLICSRLGVPGFGAGSRLLPAILVAAGYLSTVVIVRVHDQHEGLSISQTARLWWQHLRCVWPSLLCVVAFTSAICAVISVSLLGAMTPDVLPSLGLYENWSALVRNVAPHASTSPLAGMWFPAVEVQLFLVWSLILSALLRASKAVARRTTFAFAILGTASLILQCVLGGNLLRVSLATDAYVCSYMFGAWLAFAFPLGRVPAIGKDLLIKPMGPRNRHMRGRRYQATTFTNVLGFVSFAIIVLLVALVPVGGTLTLGFTHVAISVCTMLLIATLIAPGNLLAKGIGVPPLRYLGTRALGIYLWTTPLYQLAVAAMGSAPWYLLIAVAIVIIAAAEVTYRLVELPFAGSEITGSTSHNVAPYRLATTALVVAIAAAFGAHALLNVPATGTNESAASASEANLSTTDGAATQPTADNTANEGASTGTATADEDSSTSGQKETKRVTIDEDTIIYAPAKETRAGKFDPVLVGDSVPGDADWSRLPDALIDTYIGRRPDQALEVIRGYLDQDAVGSVVVLACFSNVTATPDQLDEFAELLGSDREIYVVGTVNPDGFMDEANENLQDACSRHKNMHYIDWPAVEEGHEDEYLWADATHLRPEGGVAYVNMVVDAIADDLIEAGGTTE